jgi:LSD1 subclass zinc finger protein
MRKNTNLGFTLVELLVVIAIIGILSSVVLASLNVARSKGADAKVKAQIAAARNSAEIYFDANGSSYNGLAGDVPSDCTTIDSMFQDTASGMDQHVNPLNYPPGTTIRCSSTNSTYMISASLSSGTDFWCIDTSGASKEISAADHATAHPDGDDTCD